MDEIFRVRKLLRDAVGFEFLGKAPKAADFERLVSLVREILPGEVRYDVLEDSLRHVAGTHIDEELLDSFCWRMAANVKRLKQRRAVPPWHSQKLPEWVPVQIVSCRRMRNPKGKMGAQYGFRILAGTPCTLTIHEWWSTRLARFYAHDFGYSRPRGRAEAKYPFSALEDLVGMRAYALIEPKLCDKAPGFDKLAFPDGAVKWNVGVIKRRLRILPGFTCMAGRKASQTCRSCPVGFLKCAAATHRRDWEEKHCSKCGETTWFDPELSNNLCVSCYAEKAMEKDA